MDYTKYSTEELAADHSFVQWANRTDAEAERFWDAWVVQHPEMAHKVSRARTLVLNLRRVESTFIPEKVVDDIWARLNDRIIASEPVHTGMKPRHFVLYPLAAVMALLVVAVVWWSSSVSPYDPQVIQSNLADEFIEEINTSGGVLRVHLSEGSTITLQNNSRLRYKKNYQGESSRRVYLTGEAFFDVAKDPTQPFIVHSGEVVTRVLGTSFWVRAADDADKVVVSVKTGKVSVYTMAEGESDDDELQKNAVILLPNQQVTYEREHDSFGKSLVPQPTILVPALKAETFNFENTPIKQVFKTLEDAYGIEIIFDEEVMSNCHITAPLGNEPLFEKLKIICRAIGARYETIDAKVVISSTGC